MSGKKLETNNVTDTVKLLMVGQSSVGKTSLLIRYTDNKFDSNTQLTIGIDGKNVIRKIDNHNVKIQFWDTAGQQKFGSLPTNYYKRVNGIIFVYDITNIDSFDKVEDWFEKIEQNNNPKDLILMLVGNKLDLKTNREVSVNDGQEFAKLKGMKFKEASAKDNTNVQQIFVDITKSILEKGILGDRKMVLGNESTHNDSGCCS